MSQNKNKDIKGSATKPSNKKRSEKFKKKGNSENLQAMKIMNKDFSAISGKPATNDPDWYFTSKELAEQVATFPFPYFIGASPNIGTLTSPSILIGFVSPSPGITQTRNLGGSYVTAQTSGANMAAQKIYTRLSIASGRTANYQANDVLMSILGTTELVSLIEYARRFFGIATTYNQRNRVFAMRILGMLSGEMQNPTAATLQNSVFGSDFVTHLADYRMQLNSLITKVNQIPILADIGYVRKSIELYQKIYLDDPTDVAQVYALCPYSTWELDETGESGSVLKTVPIYKSITTFADILTIISNCADALLNSTTLNYVYADMFNYQAKFSMNFFRMDYVLEGYSVIPEFSERFLQQIHNASAMGGTCPRATWEAFTDDQKGVTTPENDVVSEAATGFIRYSPCFSRSLPHGIVEADERELLFDFASSTPTLEDKIDNIMFRCGTPTAKIGTSAGVSTWCYGQPLPDHYINFFNLYGAHCAHYIEFINSGFPLGLAREVNVGATWTTGFEWTNTTTEATNLSMLYLGCALSMFTYYPMLVGYNETSNSVALQPNRIVGVKCFPTTITQKHFKQMLELVYQGLFELR